MTKMLRYFVVLLLLVSVGCSKSKENSEEPPVDIEAPIKFGWKLVSFQKGLTLPGSANEEMNSKIESLVQINDVYSFEKKDTCIITTSAGGKKNFPYSISNVNHLKLNVGTAKRFEVGYLGYKVWITGNKMQFIMDLEECKRLIKIVLETKEVDGSLKYTEKQKQEALRNVSGQCIIHFEKVLPN